MPAIIGRKNQIIEEIDVNADGIFESVTARGRVVGIDALTVQDENDVNRIILRFGVVRDSAPHG